MSNIRLQIKSIKCDADETICISTLKHQLGLKHNEAKYIVNIAKRQQVQTIEIPIKIDRNEIVSNLNFVGIQTACL